MSSVYWSSLNLQDKLIPTVFIFYFVTHQNRCILVVNVCNDYYLEGNGFGLTIDKSIFKVLMIFIDH